jgi:hypothetical protein
LIGTLGLIASFIGAMMLTCLAVAWGVSRLFCYESNYVYLSGRPVVLYSVALLLLGSQLLSIGFIAELLVAYQNRTTKWYSVKTKIKDEK